MSTNGTTGANIASSSGGTGTERNMILICKKTFNWTIVRSGDLRIYSAQKIEFPMEAGPATPAMTWTYFLSPEINSYSQLYPPELWLNCTCTTNGNESRPMYKTQISVIDPDGYISSVFESGLQNDRSRFPFRNLLSWSPNGLLHLQIILEIYGKKAIIEDPSQQWNKQHEQTIKTHFQNMLRTGHLSDVKIISKDGEIFPAHKLILRAGSEVFEAMFTHDMIESQSGVITLSDMSWRAVKFLLHFIYSAEILPIAKDKEDETGKGHATIEEVIYLASKYGLNDLLDHLDKRIEYYCTVKNAWGLLKLCKMHNLERGKEMAYAFMLKNQGDLVKDFVFSQI